MNYWLFSIMYDWYPGTWPKMVAMEIAAQHYPPGWTNERKNLKHLEQLKRGDKVLAAFHGHRFGGYGTLTSDFYRGGPSMEFKDRRRILEFQERADCDWTTLPLRGEHSFIDLHELKKKGFNTGLTIGLCVKKIDKVTFEAVRNELDEAGATQQSKPPVKESPPSADESNPGMAARKSRMMTDTSVATTALVRDSPESFIAPNINRMT